MATLSLAAAQGSPQQATREDVAQVRAWARRTAADGNTESAAVLNRLANTVDRVLSEPDRRTGSLTKQQRRVLDYIGAFIESRGYSPSFEEIAAGCGYASLATVFEHVSNLQAKGYLRRDHNKSRSLELVQPEAA